MLVVLLGCLACRQDPVERGMSLQTAPHRGEKELKTLRVLCALRGDAICGEYIAEVSSQNQEDHFGSGDPGWFGTPREIPESSKFH